MKEILGKYIENQKLADPHVHTNRSPDGHVEPKRIIDLAEAGGILNLIAITDHNKISPSYEAYEYAQKSGYRIEVVPRIGNNNA